MAAFKEHSNRKNRTVSAVAVIDLANELVQRNLMNVSEWVSLLPEYQSLTSNTLENNSELLQEARIDERRLVDLWHHAEKQSREGNLGFELGSKVNTRAKGLLANWLTQSDSLGAALAVFRENIALLNPSEHWSLEYATDKSYVELVFEFRSPYEYPHMAYERSMVALIAWGEYLCGKRIQVDALQFTFPEPAHSAQLFSHFGENVIFNGVRNCIRISLEVFDRPLHTANAYLHSVIAQRARSVLNAISVSLTFSDRVAKLIRSDIRYFSQVEKLAEICCMSRATLYRKLKEENQTYQNLLNHERKLAAQKALRENIKVEVISYNLGFKDKRSFYKAYKRWFNQTPKDTS